MKLSDLSSESEPFDALDHSLSSYLPQRQNKISGRVGLAGPSAMSTRRPGLVAFSAPQPIASKVEEDSEHLVLAASAPDTAPEEADFDIETVATTTEEDGSSSSPQYSTETPSITPLPGITHIFSFLKDTTINKKYIAATNIRISDLSWLVPVESQSTNSSDWQSFKLGNSSEVYKILSFSKVRIFLSYSLLTKKKNLDSAMKNLRNCVLQLAIWLLVSEPKCDWR